MLTTWCGKDCGQCPEFGVNCPGCKGGPGSAWGGDCEIARCCRSRSHDSCATCIINSQCSLLSGREEVPASRAQRAQQPILAVERMRGSAPILAKWLTTLFWLQIVHVAMTFLESLIPRLQTVSLIVNLVCTVIMFVALFKLGRAESYYRTSAVISLVCAAIDLVLLVIPNLGLAIFIVVATFVADFVAYYFQFAAHAEVLCGVNDELSAKWRKLWRWYIGTFCALIAFLLLALLLPPVLALLLLLAAAIGLLVVLILMLIYLHRTAEIFRNIASAT